MTVYSLKMSRKPYWSSGFEYLGLQGEARVELGQGVETTIKLSAEASDKIAEIVIDDAISQLKRTLNEK